MKIIMTKMQKQTFCGSWDMLITGASCRQGTLNTPLINWMTMTTIDTSQNGSDDNNNDDNGEMSRTTKCQT